MAQIRIPCLVPRTNKAGIVSWYWQPSATLAKAGWKPLALGKNSDAAFQAANARNREVEIWKAGGAKPRDVKQKVLSGTFGALIERYRKEVVYGIDEATGRRRIRDSTAGTYEIALKRLDAWAGKHPVGFITPARVTALRNSNARPIEKGGIGHSATFNMLKILRQIFAYAERHDIIAKGSNPAKAFDLGAPPPRSQVWEADDEAAFIAAAYDLGMPSMALAIELALYSAQREADLILFTESQIEDLEIHNDAVRRHFVGKDGKVRGWILNQIKTSDEHKNTVVRMEIPLEPKIRAKVEAAIRTNRARDRAAEPKRLLTYVLVDDLNGGRPWRKRDFCQAYRDVINHAIKATGRTNMADLVWHDLRRTRVVRLRRRGMTPAEIASITGHSPQSIHMMLKVYGPVDPTITAAAIASTLVEPTPAKPRNNRSRR